MDNLTKAERLLWSILLLLVPISSSPLLPLGAGTQERPLAVVPAIVLLAIAAFRVLARRERPAIHPGGGWLLVVFLGYVIVSGLVEVSFLPEEVFKGQTPQESFMRALATLVIGGAFYLVARLNIRTLDDVRRTVRFLFIGLGASIGLAVLQVGGIVAGGETLRLMQSITYLFAMPYQTLTYLNRAQGMAYEPSWLATQIVLLLIPPLVAIAISRQSSPDATPSGRNVWVALLGFTLALTGLLCAGSRFGIIAALLLLLLGGFMALLRGRLVAALGFAGLLLAGGGGIIALSSVGAGAGASYVLGPLTFLTDGTQEAITADSNAASVADVFSFATRAAAAQAAFNQWLAHPLFGVSFGNDYRYFGRYAPDWAFDTGVFNSGTYEGANWLDPNAPEKGNAKNLILRLLAETGVMGFALYLTFCWRQIFFYPGRDAYYIYFRVTAAAAIIFAGVNQDSFTDPAVWIVLALCVAIGRLQASAPQERVTP